MMQHMFHIEMLICQFPFIDFFLPSEMTNFSYKCGEQLWGVFLWEHPARLLRFSIMSLLMKLHNTSFTLIAFPGGYLFKKAIAIRHVSLIIMLFACEGDVLTKRIDFFHNLGMFVFDTHHRYDPIGWYGGDTIRISIQRITDKDIHQIEEMVRLRALPSSLRRFLLCTFLRPILPALESFWLTKETPGLAPQCEHSHPMNICGIFLCSPFLHIPVQSLSYGFFGGNTYRCSHNVAQQSDDGGIQYHLKQQSGDLAQYRASKDHRGRVHDVSCYSAVAMPVDQVVRQDS